VASDPKPRGNSQLHEANRKLRLALKECQQLLERTERLLKSQQDN
jgi:hypothetical protein